MFWNWIASMYLIMGVSVFYFAKEYCFKDRLIMSALWLPLWIILQIKYFSSKQSEGKGSNNEKNSCNRI